MQSESPKPETAPLRIIERRCSRCGTVRLSLLNDASDRCPECSCMAWHGEARYLSHGLVNAIRGAATDA